MSSLIELEYGEWCHEGTRLLAAPTGSVLVIRSHSGKCAKHRRQACKAESMHKRGWVSVLHRMHADRYRGLSPIIAQFRVPPQFLLLLVLLAKPRIQTVLAMPVTSTRRMSRLCTLSRRAQDNSHGKRVPEQPPDPMSRISEKVCVCVLPCVS